VTAFAEPVRIERIASGGDGVGRLPDGRTVFVPRSAPGDVVTLRDVQLHKRFARARVADIVEHAGERVVPPCPHYVRDSCGGCQLQHLAVPAQEAAKRAIVGDALRRLGKFDIADPELEPAPAAWHYRSRITLHRAERADRIGFHRLGAPGSIFELDTCLIADERLVALWRVVRRHRGLLPAVFDGLTLRIERGGGEHVLLRAKGDDAWTKGRELAQRLAAGGRPATVWWQPERGAARVVGGGTDLFPAAAFEQVNPAMGDLLRAHALEQLGEVAGRHAWDLYAGIGEATAALAARGATVESVEWDKHAVQVAVARGPEGPRRLAARVEDAMDRLRPPDVVLTNPPRAGMELRVVDAIAAHGPSRLVYISCDPATLARDLTRLGERYRLVHARAFDLFPQTAHVETVAVMERT
jgi:23S rRNA (uracil1939-C5)-methyltransferase